MEDSMKKRNVFLLGLLVVLLAMGMVFVGCDPYDDDSSGSNNNGGNNNPGGNNPGGGTSIPSAPTGVTATAQSASSIQVSWSAVSGATSYRVEVRTTSTGSWSTLTTVTGTSHTHTGLSASTQRWYRIFAINSAGTSSASNIVNATTSTVAVPTFTPPTRAQLEAFLESYRTTTTLMGGSAAVYIRSIAVNTYSVNGVNITSSPSPVPESAQVTVRFTVRTILGFNNLSMGERMNIDNFRGDLQSALRNWLRDRGFGQFNINITTGDTIFG
jgi:hypothetical protein